MIANRKKRFYSTLIDYLVIVAYIVCLVGISMLFYMIFYKGELPIFNELQSNIISFVTLLLPVFLYFVITESTSKHATLGKRKAGIYVASIKGSITLWQIILRNMIKLLPWQMAHMAIFNVFANNSEPTLLFYFYSIFIYLLPIVNIAFMVCRKDRKALHDLISNTVILIK